MNTLKIEGTDESPEVILDAENGECIFKGKSLPEDVTKFYKPILSWIDEYVKRPNKKTTITFELDYFNSASSKQIHDIIENFAHIDKGGNDLLVKWRFFEDDEDMEEAGESYSDIIGIPFEMIAY